MGTESSTAVLQVAEEKVQGRGESGGEGPRTEERRPGPQQPLGPPGPAGVHAGHAPVSESTYGPRKHSTAGTEDHLRLGGSLSPAAALAAVPSLWARSSGQPQLSRPLVRPALGLGNVRVRSQVAEEAGGQLGPPKQPSPFPGKPSVWRLRVSHSLGF